MNKTPAPIFNRRKCLIPSSALPSSSPSFGTPVHPLKPFNVTTSKAGILPVLLPPATLRPLAFRVFTKKHSLTLTSSALQALASFIGRHCGSGWREEGLAEGVLEEAARSWKNRNGGVIVDGASKELHEILKTLEGNMRGGKLVAPGRGLPRGDSALEMNPNDFLNSQLGIRPDVSMRDDGNTSFGVSGLGVQDGGNDEDETNDPRAWLQVIGAFEQPRLFYNATKKHFERDNSKPSLFPQASHKTAAFRNRYHVVYQRVLRDESFQTSTVASYRPHRRQKSSCDSKALKITRIANMIGRHGSNHMLLGQLCTLPTGGLAISDLTGTIALDLNKAVTIPKGSAWFCPGMIVLVDGVYEEENESIGKGLSGSSGVGGTLGGRFQGFFIGQPLCEKRNVTLSITSSENGADQTIGGGFGWIDFLGVGSERAVGQKMRRLERRLLAPPPLAPTIYSSGLCGGLDDDPAAPPTRGRVVILGELNLDQPRALEALRRILVIYAGEPEGCAPVAFVLTGNFTRQAALVRGRSGGSVTYKKCFDALAAILYDFPALLRASTFVFVPGDNDGWMSTFLAGASAPLPQAPVPDLFTSRIRRAFAAANAEASGSCARGGGVPGSAVWTSNPSRISLFGPTHDLVLFRDDISARLGRMSVRFEKEETQRKKDVSSAEAMEVDKDGDDGGGAGADADADADADDDFGRSQRQPTPQVHAAQKLVKTLLSQGHLSPFRTSVRPLHWDFEAALQLYPLPTALVLVDTTAPPFCISYEGCHVMNPGPILACAAAAAVAGRKDVGRWVEYDVCRRLGRIRECTF